jgi:hypothetical protein
MPAERIPSQALVIGAQNQEAGGGQAAAAVPVEGVGLSTHPVRQRRQTR